MSQQGRGGAMAVPILCIILLSAGLATATEYIVGDSNGWSPNVVNWPNGKTFKVNDVLVFNYDPQFHNVMLISEEDVGIAYENCMIPSYAPSFQTGSDKIMLDMGMNYFICGFPGTCENGMKIAVDAE